MLNQKTVTISGPELLILDFRTSQTEEILISRTNHQLYFILNLRIFLFPHAPYSAVLLGSMVIVNREFLNSWLKYRTLNTLL